MFSSSTFQRLGLLEEAFTPFGYEDAEMGVRVRRSGQSVALLPSELVLHDLQSRHKERSPLIAAATRAKARAILIRKHGGRSGDVANAVLESFVVGWAEAAMYRTGEGGAAAAALAYASGLVAGLFRELTEPSIEVGVEMEEEWLVRLGKSVTSYSSNQDHGQIPTEFSGSAPVLINLRVAPILNGLPETLVGQVAASYRLEPSGTFSVKTLSLEFPGLLKVGIEGEMSGIRTGEDHAESLLANTLLHYVKIEITDLGLINRFEETHAWFVDRRSNGRLLELVGTWQGPVGGAVRRFLDPCSNRQKLIVQAHPVQPVSTRDLTTMEGGSWHLRRRLGLRARTYRIGSIEDFEKEGER